MCQSQNGNTGNKRRQGNMIPQKGNNHKIEVLVDNEGDESSDAEVRRMKIRMFNKLKMEHKQDIQKQPSESQQDTLKILTRHRNT
jgi:hypothetical protein